MKNNSSALRARFTLLILLLALLLPLAAIPALAAQTVHVTGVLTDEGVECPALRGDDGQLYTLTPRSSTAGFNVGDRVRVSGKVAEVSFCGQGTTLEVKSIKVAK
jgi:hypothetical protein